MILCYKSWQCHLYRLLVTIFRQVLLAHFSIPLKCEGPGEPACPQTLVSLLVYPSGVAFHIYNWLIDLYNLCQEFFSEKLLSIRATLYQASKML